MNVSAPAPVAVKKSKTKYIVIGALLLVTGLGAAAYFKNKKANAYNKAY